MGMKYRILDYQNGRIISDIGNLQNVCVTLRAVASYSNSFAVVTHNDEFITHHFVQDGDGHWNYNRPAEQG